MRMWMLPPEKMCIQHIIGEHGELHKHRHNFIKKHSISGRISPIVQIEPESMKVRHDLLARFLKNHNSPFEQPDLSYLPDAERFAKVDLEVSGNDLYSRCEACRLKITEAKP